MAAEFYRKQSHAAHAFGDLHARTREGLTLVDRRGMLKAGLAGMAGLSLPQLLQARAEAAQTGRGMASRKSVILLWMAGGPSQIDTWDPKPERPLQNRGPFGVTATKLPGVFFCEHLPKMASMLDRFTVIRSVDPSGSSHEPNTVMQTGNLEAEPRTNPEADKYPAIASLVAKFRGPNHPAMPPYVTFMKSRSHLAYAGYLGKQFDPFQGNQAARLPVYDLVGKDSGKMTGADLFQLPGNLNADRVQNRRALMEEFDKLRSDLDQSGTMDAVGTYHRQAVEMVIGRQAQTAFDLEQEPAAMRDKYGKHLWCQQALLARRLVEAGVSFVTIDLSYHTASGTWDTHGDNIPPYGGIKNGLGPLLPLFDHLYTTLLTDLGERGLLDEVLVLAMGEFGRTPQMGTQDSTDGRNHWPSVMSMCVAGGGLRHGQVIGASEADGGKIKERPVTPTDLAATIYRHMDVPLDGVYHDHRGRPRPIVENNGQPIRELF
ncbi:MAG: DUF1501 domain-containing protein [Planctomycetaceae bacterium]|nr:DUF1501 domain-containing protein [Planctomycetaceae bacterium]